MLNKPFFIWNKDKIKPFIAANNKPLSKEEIICRELITTLERIDNLYDSDNGMHHKMADLIQYTMYNDIPKHITQKLGIKPQFDYLIKQYGGNIDNVIVNIIKSGTQSYNGKYNTEYLEKYRYVIETFYPKYLEKFDKLLVLV